jgi:signal transduction histidine kinase
MRARKLESRLRVWGWGGFALIAGAYSAALLVLFLVWQRQAQDVNGDLDTYTRTEAMVLARLFLYDLSSDPRIEEMHRLETLLAANGPSKAESPPNASLLALVRDNLTWPDTEIWKKSRDQGLKAGLEDITQARDQVYREMLQDRSGGIRDDLWARVTFSDNLRGVTLISVRGSVISVGEPLPESVLAGPSRPSRELGRSRLLVTLPLTVQASRWGTAYFLMDRAIVSRLADGLLATLARSMWALAGLMVLLVGAWSLWWTLLLRRVRKDVVLPIVSLARRMEGDPDGQPPSSFEGSEPEWLSEAFDRLIQRLTQQQEQLLSAQKLGLMERVGAGLSHELNNALNPARLRLDEMFMEGRAPSLEDVAVLREYLSHAQQVLKDLAFAVKRPSGPLGTFPPSAWLSVARRLVEPALHEAATLEWEAPEDRPEVYGEPQWLVQVAVNLLLNAKDATASTGALGRIRVSLSEESEGEVLLRIVDDGPGVAAEVAGHIFEPFVTSKPRGSGLGLFVVDQLVRKMGGRVRLLSGVPGGTVAEVWLRRDPPEES